MRRYCCSQGMLIIGKYINTPYVVYDLFIEIIPGYLTNIDHAGHNALSDLDRDANLPTVVVDVDQIAILDAAGIGIGPKRKRALMKRFGSLRAIKEAPLEEIATVIGMTRELAKRVKEYL